MTRWASVRTGIYVAALAALALAALATPASAQQLIDASTDGGLAFFFFAIMWFIFVATLFYMDRIRRKRGGGD